MLTMKKIFNILFVLIFFIGSSCGEIKRGLLGVKKTSTDEFLVQKKDPLVFPPNFHDLPVPKELSEEREVLDEDVEISLQNIDIEKTTSDSVNNGNIEKSILKKIQNN